MIPEIIAIYAIPIAPPPKAAHPSQKSDRSAQTKHDCPFEKSDRAS